MPGENDELMDVFEDSDFSDEEIEDTNDEDSEENEEESDEADDETKEDDADLEDAGEDDLEDAAAKKDDEPNPATATPKTFKVKVNHQELEVSEEDAVKFIQMGMDYDRVKDQVNTYKNDPRLSFVENLAKQHNMTPDQYINAVYENQYQAEIAELIESGVKADVAKEVVDTRRQKQQDSQTQEQSQSQKQEEKELLDFVEYYAKINGKQFNPDTDTLPDEVWKLNADGTPLKVAYMEHLLQQKKEQDKQSQKQEALKKQNEEAKKKAPVKGVSMNGTGKSPKKDPQLDGLFDD